jgi:hypothetical protein
MIEYSTIELVVKHHFKNYQPGDVITDAAEVEAILTSHHETYVVKRAKPKT